ncbi:CoA transferase [Pelagibacterium flavum]|jgi:formyl-CoA transferase|uniref:CoA transferase n=1 Tax=Pelagibacterium flavum TaxID=2984530 RepID=A0ABY6IR45_9HYPH|nr:CoA transferase [Pelagibacterium sp. YIM 151497]UYQ73093.1 CoA transferase [Pelagibacterium sp. YIM 151497]|tara:strand:- start:90099 stop:91292 length:1194 start_codon:yes stop_codon:yes gene_type:complete
MTLPLEGMRVLDVSQVMAGPFCCMMLGDMGADVIKIEPPVTGDQTRRSMGFRLNSDDSPGFLALNRNKRSIAINLKSKAGLEIFYRLVETADVLVENNRPGVAKRLGIDYETVRKINPRLIYASISGFGQTGPYADRPGFDLIAQAMSGVLSVTGSPGGEPVKSSVPVGDLGAGLFTIYGILSAYIGRQTSGVGQYIDSSLIEAAMALSVWEVTEFWGTGKVPQPLGTANRMSAPYQAVKASDGYIVVGAANQKLWKAFCDVLGRPELFEDPRFASNVERLANRAELIAEFEPIFATKPAEHWVSALLAAGVPAAPVNNFEESLGSEHAKVREMVMEIDHPAEGKIKALGFPVKMRGTPQEVRYPPPMLGEHRDQILAEIGLSGKVEDLEAGDAFSK